MPTIHSIQLAHTGGLCVYAHAHVFVRVRACLHIFVYVCVHILTPASLLCCVCAVLKRGKVKKSKNDLIGAEEGEDHFTDMSSVGKTQPSCTLI